MTLSSTFTVEGAAVTGAVAVAYGTTVDLALTSLTDVCTVSWSIVGSSDPSYTDPTITPAGTPLGATASFPMIADPGTGEGASFMVQVICADAYGNTSTSRAIVGVNNAVSLVPFCAGEKLERHSTHGWTGQLNQTIATVAGSAPGAGDDNRMAYALTSAFAFATEVLTDGTYVAIGATTAATGDLRGDTAFKLVALSGANDLDVIAVSSGDLLWGDATYCDQQRSYVTSSGSWRWFRGANRSVQIDGAGLTVFNQADDTDLLRVNSAATQTTISRVTGGGTANSCFVLYDDTVQIGNDTNTDAVESYVASGGSYTWDEDTDEIALLDTSGLTLSPAGATTSATGTLKLPQNGSVWCICASGPADAAMIAGNNPDLEIGDAAWVTVKFDSTSGYEFDVSSNKLAAFSTTDFRLFDPTDATQYVAVGHTSIYGSKDLDSAFVIGVVTATGTDDGQDINIITASAPAGQTPGDLIVTLGNDTTPTVWASFTVETSAGNLWNLGTGGMTIYDHADSAAYVTVEHDAVLFSKGNTGGVTIDMEDVTAAADGNELLITGSGCPYGNNPGDVILRTSVTATNNINGSILLQDSDAHDVVEVSGDGSNGQIGFLGATPASQRSDTGAITDSTGGAVDGTLAAISGSGDDTNINNNFADLADRVNDIRDLLRTFGLMA
jgi:hypothetical protein